MEVFTKKGNNFPFLTISTKSSILDVYQDSEFASESSNNLVKKLHLRCLTGSWIHLCINYFHKAVAYLFTKIDQHIPPYIKQYSIVDGQIHVTLSSTYLFFNNENYSSAS